MNTTFSAVLSAYDLKESTAVIVPFGTGLINHTWKVDAEGKAYILQKINQHVFAEPLRVAHNHRRMADHLKQYHPDYFFVEPLRTTTGDEMIWLEGDGWYRLVPFVAGSHTVDVVQTPQQAFEAARQFSRFTRVFSGMDVSRLQITIPSFHDLSLRSEQFMQAIQNGNQQRRAACSSLIDELLSQNEIVKQYEDIKSNPDFKLRVTHHDTKISNVLFNSSDQGICVIDLDTVMPGYFISDVGDMMRTYLSPVSEEENDLSKIDVREGFYKAVVEGYYAEMQDELTAAEKAFFFYAGQFMIYMQALRFLTDHLNNDVYYGARYEGHNLVRATNQAALLQQLVKKRNVLEDITNLKA